jgi:hypothetical protein
MTLHGKSINGQPTHAGGNKIAFDDSGTERTVSNLEPLPVSASIDTTGLATAQGQQDIIDAIEAIPGGGGIQYEDGDASASPTGTQIMFNDGGIETAVSDSNPLPVSASIDTTGLALAANQQTDALTDTELRATPVPVSGTVTANIGTVATLATAAKQDTGNTSLASIDTKTPALGQAVAAASVPVVLPAAQITTLTPQTDALTDTELRATPVPVSATNLDIRDLTNADVVTAELSAVDNAVLDTIDAVLDTIKVDTEAIETAVEAIQAAQLPDGHNVTVDNASIAVTGTFFQATQPVSGTVTANLAAGTNNIGDVDVLSLPAIPAGNNNIGDVDIATIAAGDNNIGNVDVVTLPSIPAGTNNIGDVDVLSLPALPAGNNNIGDVDVASIVPGTAATNLGKAEDAAHASGDTLVAIAQRRIDTAATSADTSGDYATANQSAEGAGWVTTTPTTTSGCSIFRSLDLDESEEEVKATAGNVYGYYFYNAAASIRYLKFYNATAANTTVGTTTPVLTIPVPATTAGHVTFPYAVSFATAISAAVTTGLADADTGAPAANDFILNVYYK